jgi:hypothetical protein
MRMDRLFYPCADLRFTPPELHDMTVGTRRHAEAMRRGRQVESITLAIEGSDYLSQRVNAKSGRTKQYCC